MAIDTHLRHTYVDLDPLQEVFGLALIAPESTATLTPPRRCPSPSPTRCVTDDLLCLAGHAHTNVHPQNGFCFLETDSLQVGSCPKDVYTPLAFVAGGGNLRRPDHHPKKKSLLASLHTRRNPGSTRSCPSRCTWAAASDGTPPPPRAPPGVGAGFHVMVGRGWSGPSLRRRRGGTPT